MGRSSELTGFDSFSVDHLVQIQDAIDSTLLTIVKANGKPPSTVSATRNVENRLASQVTTAWKKTAKTGLEEPIDRLFARDATENRVSAFLSRLGVTLSNPLTKGQERVAEAQIERIWRTSKRLAAKESGIGFSFSGADVGAIKQINRHQVFWIGDFYDVQLSKRIRAVTEDVIFKQGLSGAEGGKVLRSALKREFGIFPGGKSGFAKDVLARYAGNTDLYFEQVVSTAAHQSRTFAKMTAFKEAEIITYRLLNPNDERTGQVCQQMSGQVFSVDVGVKQMNKILQATDPTEIKSTAPWLSGDAISEVIDGARTGSKDAAQRLAEAGAILPPFHPLCRTEPIVMSAGPSPTAQPVPVSPTPPPPKTPTVPGLPAGFAKAPQTLEALEAMTEGQIRRAFSTSEGAYWGWMKGPRTAAEIDGALGKLNADLKSIEKVRLAGRRSSSAKVKLLRESAQRAEQARDHLEELKAFYSPIKGKGVTVSGLKDGKSIVNRAFKEFPSHVKRIADSEGLQILYDSGEDLASKWSTWNYHYGRSRGLLGVHSNLERKLAFRSDPSVGVSETLKEMRGRTLTHELTHHIDDTQFQGRLNELWKRLPQTEYVSAYARTSAAEDLAESVENFRSNVVKATHRKAIEKSAPTRADIVERIFANDDNYKRSYAILQWAEDTKSWRSAIKDIMRLEP